MHAVKLYPAGATTNSDAGVSDLKKCAATLARMEKLGVPLLVHGEVTDPAVDIFDREAVFIDTVLSPLLRDFPALKVVLEHVTTRNGIDFVQRRRRQCRGDADGASPAAQPQRDFRRRHSAAPLLPAGAEAREPSSGAGRGGDLGQPEILSRHRFGAARRRAPRRPPAAAPAATPRTPASNCMPRSSRRPARWTGWKASPVFIGADFYGLPRNTEKITLRREAMTIPASLDYVDGDRLVPLRAGETVAWRLE